jgi:spore germination cell wall hydrolase CwlJ-like protein
MYNNHNQQVSGCVAKTIVVLTIVLIGGIFFISTPTIKPLPYVQVTQEQLDYDPVPELREYDPELEKYRSPVEIFKIQPPSFTTSPDAAELGIILHASKEIVVLSETDRNCLIRNVFYEAGAEPYAGKIAVAQVTWNRVRSGAWGKTVCQVVHAPNQFSWTRDAIKKNRHLSGLQVDAVRDAVDAFQSGVRVAKLHSSMHFHTAHVKPGWAADHARVKRIGGHVFYALK